MTNTNDFLYGSKNIPMESNFMGAHFNINGSSFDFRVTDCVESEGFYNLSDGKGNVIKVPIKSVEDLFNDKSITAILDGHGPIGLTLSKASTNSHIQKYMDDPDHRMFKDDPIGLDEVRDFDINGWRNSLREAMSVGPKGITDWNEISIGDVLTDVRNFYGEKQDKLKGTFTVIGSPKPFSDDVGEGWEVWAKDYRDKKRFLYEYESTVKGWEDDIELGVWNVGLSPKDQNRVLGTAPGEIDAREDENDDEE